MTRNEFQQYVIKIDMDLKDREFRKVKSQTIEMFKCFLSKFVKCSKNNANVFFNQLRWLISVYLYCISKEESKNYIFEDRIVLQAITFCKAAIKEFERETEKSEEWIDINLGLSTVSQKIYRSQTNTKNLFYNEREERKNLDDLGKLLRKKEELERKMDLSAIWNKVLTMTKSIRIEDDSPCLEFVCYLDLQTRMNCIEKNLLKFSILLHQNINGRMESRWLGEIPQIVISKIDNYIRLTKKLNSYDSMESLVEISDLIVNLIWPNMKKWKRIFWIPDNLFYYIPMEILFCPGSEKQLIDVCDHVYLDSMLDYGKQKKIDLLNANSLVIGGSEYEISRNSYDPETDKKAKEAMKQINIEELNCSKFECLAVGKLCNTTPFMSDCASKKTFFENCEGNEIIHLSTHGELFEAPEFDNVPFAGLGLILSGYKNWYIGRYVADYGNGCLTAQEISMTDLENAKLVVISSCISAVNVYKDSGKVASIRSAFEMAGAGQTVAALWDIDDCSTAILMILFYRNLYQHEPSLALTKAKRKLRGLTYKEIKEDKEFFSLWKISGREALDKNNRPFQEIYFWAAFICHKNRSEN